MEQDSINGDGTELATNDAIVTLKNNLNRIRFNIIQITGEAWGTVSHSIAAVWAKFHATTGHKHTGAADDAPNLAGTVIINTPAGTIAATNVQTALNELDNEKETPAGSQAKVDSHAALTASHGQATIEGTVGSQAKVDTHAALSESHGRTNIDGVTERNAAITAAIAGKGARVYNDAAISIQHATDTALTFNTERYDTDTIHDLDTNPGRLTCKTAGIYSITGHVFFATTSETGIRQTYIRINGATGIAAVSTTALGFHVIQNVVTLFQLAVNDYLELVVYQDSGASLNINSIAASSPEFAMQRISP